MEFRLASVYYGLMNKNDDKAKEWLDLVSVHASRMEDNKNDLLPRVYIEVDSRMMSTGSRCSTAL